MKFDKFPKNNDFLNNRLVIYFLRQLDFIIINSFYVLRHTLLNDLNVPLNKKIVSK